MIFFLIITTCSSLRFCFFLLLHTYLKLSQGIFYVISHQWLTFLCLLPLHLLYQVFLLIFQNLTLILNLVFFDLSLLLMFLMWFLLFFVEYLLIELQSSGCVFHKNEVGIEVLKNNLLNRGIRVRR